MTSPHHGSAADHLAHDLFLPFDPTNVISTPFSKASEWRQGLPAVAAADGPAAASFGAPDAAGPQAAGGAPSDQFCIFALPKTRTQLGLLDCSEVEPELEGTDDLPDVQARVSLMSFRVGSEEPVDSSDGATMRVVIGKDPDGPDRLFENAFWAVSAGLQLWDSAGKEKTPPKELKGDFSKALGNRPIEIPGGVAQLQFQVIKHQGTPWWKKIFGFLDTGAGKRVVSVLGFPALGLEALGLVGDLLDRVVAEKPKVLFRSLPLRLAATKRGKEYLEMGSEVVVAGSLWPGYYVFIRGQDQVDVAKAKARYFLAHDLLVPEGMEIGQALAEPAANPLNKITYAVFRIDLKAAKFDPTFDYRPRGP